MVAEESSRRKYDMDGRDQRVMDELSFEPVSWFVKHGENAIRYPPQNHQLNLTIEKEEDQMT